MGEILALVVVERAAIVNALRELQDAELASKALMICRSTIYRKMASYEITPAEWRGPPRAVEFYVGGRKVA